MTTRERRITQPLDQPTPQTSGLHDATAVGEVRELLRQARVHVVEVRHAEHAPPAAHADQPAFLVRVHGVVAAAERARGSAVDASARRAAALASDGPMLNAGDERRAQAAEHPQPGHLDVAPERIRDQIDRVTQRR